MAADALAIDALCWPAARLGEAIHTLARHAGLDPAANDAPVLPPAVAPGDAAETARWVEWAAARVGLEAEAVDTAVPGVAAVLRRGGPALLCLPPARGGEGLRFVLLLGRHGQRGAQVRIVTPEARIARVPVDRLRSALCERFEAPLQASLDAVVDAVAPAERARVRRALLDERLAADTVAVGWILRRPATAGFWHQLVHARVPRRVAGLLVLFAVAYALEILGWGLIGDAALGGRLDLGWLAAWLLLVLSLVPLRWLGGWLQASVSLDAGRLLKQRLLAGALRLDLDAVRRQGAGQLLGRVMESQALESQAQNGVLGVLVALLELSFAAWILSAGVAPRGHLALLAVWTLLFAALGGRFHARLRAWTSMRLAMTQDLVEQMVGHRTRLAQQRPARRDAEDDRSLQDYVQTSQAMDRAATPVVAAAPGGWILAGLACMAPAFVDGVGVGSAAGIGAGGATPAGLAISLGGILFAHRAFTGIAAGLAALSRAVIAWQQVAPMFSAGAQAASTAPFIATSTAPGVGASLADTPGEAGHVPALVDASGLDFRYRPETPAVLRGVDISLRRGERVLLEGPSGGGKSTLAALLVGLRQPQSGLLLINGLDRHTLGDAWRRYAAGAPQFHENHILCGTLAFNLLLGQSWPASADAVQAARSLCEELGLGPLIERMPSGMTQRLGETGWQLSHGERSRIFLARALLQRAPLTVLDESFGALDPHTLHASLDCALRRTEALVVIAHP